MFPILQLGPYAVRLPGLIALGAVWLALDVASREARRLGLRAEHMYDAGFSGLLAGLVGARLWYVATYWSAYRTDILAIFSLNPATLSVSGGLVTGLGLVAWYVRRQALPLRRVLDSTALALAVFAAGSGLAHLASGSAYGVPTELPWAIYLWDDYRHPTQVYEVVLALAIFAVLLRLRRSRHPDGFLFLMFVALYAFSRLLVEPLRGDSLIWVGGFRGAEVISLAALVTSLWLLGDWAKPAPALEPARESP